MRQHEALELLGNCGARKITCRRADSGKAKRRIRTKLTGSPRTIGEHVHAKRVTLGLRQDEVGALFGVCRASVGSWEGNHYPPLGGVRAKVVEWLGFDAPDR